MDLRFQLNYRVQGPNGPFLYAADAGYFADAGLTCRFLEGISSSRASRAVAAGEADIGFGDVSAVLEHVLRTGRPDVYCVSAIYEIAPCCLAYREAGPPLRLADLAGRRLAGPSGDTSARLLPLLLEKNGLAAMPYQLLTVAPEERDRLIAAGEVAAITCFDSTLLFSMRARGYATSDLRFLYYADHGLDIYSGALLCSRAAAEARPGLLDTLAAIGEAAWTDCRARPERAVEAVLARAPQSDPKIVHDHLVWVLEHQVFPNGQRRMRFDRSGARMAATVECAQRAVGGAWGRESTSLVEAVCYEPSGA